MGDTPPDYKEVFAIGPFDRPNDHYCSQSKSYPNVAPNLWPEEPLGLELAMKNYFCAMEVLSKRIAGYFALALGLSKNWFNENLDKHASQLRLLNYPAPNRELSSGQLRCGVHTELGMITIIRNEKAAGGLQIRPRNSDWVDAPISCIETCANVAHPAKYESTSVKEYNDVRFSRGQASIDI